MYKEMFPLNTIFKPTVNGSDFANKELAGFTSKNVCLKHNCNANQELKCNHRENTLIFKMLFERNIKGDLGQIASFPRNRDKLFFLAMTTIIDIHRDIQSLRGATEAICINRYQVKIANRVQPLIRNSKKKHKE